MKRPGLRLAQGNGRLRAKGPNQVVYCGSSRAMCQLEKRVHANGANPAHPAYATVTVHIERHPFRFDPRLFVAPAPAAVDGTLL